MGIKEGFPQGYLNKDLNDRKKPDYLGGSRILPSEFSVSPNPNHTKLIREGCLESSLACVLALSHARLSAFTWTVARPAPLSMGFPRQEYWSRLLPFSPSGDLPNPRIQLESLASHALRCIGRQILYHLAPLGKPLESIGKQFTLHLIRSFQKNFNMKYFIHTYQSKKNLRLPPSLRNKVLQGVPWRSNGKDSVLPLQGLRVPSQETKIHMPVKPSGKK